MIGILEQLELTNPMIAETRILIRRFFGISNRKQFRWVVLGYGILTLYLGYLVFQNTSWIAPVAFHIIFLAMMIVTAPIVLHPVIAKEREKRSLDILMSCPITAKQLVLGKWFRSLVLAIAIAFPLYTCYIICLLSGAYMRATSHPAAPSAASAKNEFLFFLIAITGAVMFSALSMLATSIAKRTFHALLYMIIFTLLYFAMSYIVIESITFQRQGLQKNLIYFFEPFQQFFAITSGYQNNELGAFIFCGFAIAVTSLCIWGSIRLLERDLKQGDTIKNA